MTKIQLNSPTLTIEDAFENFLFAKSAQGVTDKTIKGYKSHLHCISKHLDTSVELSKLKKEATYQMITSMRTSNLSPNTIASYVRVLKAFLRWARDEGLCDVVISAYKTEETIKEVYSDEDLALLLKKPNLSKCRFSEYRTWVIINFILNSGARSSTIRSIKICDVDLKNGLVSRAITAKQITDEEIEEIKKKTCYSIGRQKEYDARSFFLLETD